MTGAIVGWHRLRSREDTKECQDDSESQRCMIHRTIRLSGERCGMWEYLGKADTEAEGIYASVSGKRQNGGKF